MPERLDRRGFLAAAATAGVALGTRFRIARADEPEAASKVVLGVIGTGGRGKNLIDNILKHQPGVQIAYLCDVDTRQLGPAAESVAKGAKQVTPKAVQDFRHILDDQAVDAVIVATCNHWHAPATIMACAAGKHVYVEKPCSHNPHEGELMVASARKHNRQVQMGTQRRSCAHIIEAIEQIHRGDLGRVYLAQSWYTNTRPVVFRGEATSAPKELDYELWQGPAPRQPFRDKLHPYNWHWFWHWGNGELGNNGIHLLDLCRWGLQVDYPIRVVSSGGRYRYQDDQETPDTNAVSFEFEDGKLAMWEGLSCSRLPNGQGDRSGTIVHFHGEKGSLAISDRTYTLYDPKGKEIRRVGDPTWEANYAGFVTSHMTNFADAIRGKAKLHAEIEEGHKSTMLCHLGNIAYRVGRFLRCRPENGQILDDEEASRLWKREYESGWEPKV